MTRGERLLAYERLLAQPDPRGMHRAHRLTQPGHPLRLEAEWLPSARMWLAQRLAQRRGVVDGWTPAKRVSRIWRLR